MEIQFTEQAILSFSLLQEEVSLIISFSFCAVIHLNVY